MKKLLIILLFVAGCAQNEPKAEIYKPNIRFEMSPQLKCAVMELMFMKSDPNIFKLWPNKGIPYKGR